MLLTPDRLIPILAAMLAAIAAMPTAVVQVCAWNVGTLKLEPWLTRSSLNARRAAANVRAWFARLFSPQMLAAAAIVLFVLLASDHAAAAVSMGTVVVTPRTQFASALTEAKAKAAKVMSKADEEQRELTAEERTEVQGYLNDAKAAKAKIDGIDADAVMRREIEALQPGEDEAPSRPGGEPKGKVLSIGQRFVQSESFKAAVANGRHRQQGFSASLEIDEYQIGATTLTEDSASGGKLVLPDYRPGILPLLFRQIRVTQLIAQGTTGSNLVEYMKETTFTNAAAPRAEGAAAAESALVFDRTSDPVRSIAHFLPTTAEMLEDVEQAQSFIDGRLRLGVALAEEDQILNGNGTAPNMSGILDRSGLADAIARGADSNADAVFKQIMAIMTNALVMPDGVVLNPANWQTIVLSKDGNGQYLGGGPFSMPPAPSLWGLPAAVTPVITANTGLVGAFAQCAQLFRRRGVTVTASNSHSDYFIKRLVAIMAEQRAALAVYRPAAFGTVTELE